MLNTSYVWNHPSWPDFQWDTQALLSPLGKARLAQGKLITQMHNLGFTLGLEAQSHVIAEETLKTAGIEGEKLNPLSVRSSVARKLGLSTSGLPKTERSVDGLVEVLLDATTNFKKPLILERIKRWQALLFPQGYSGLHQIITGQWRQTDPMQVVSGPLGREKVHFEAPPSSRIQKEMKHFLLWWNESFQKKPVEGFIRAGMAHFYFVTIHPFEDGNGRLARALTDLALAQDEKTPARFYSLSSQIMAERDHYYTILEKTQKGKGDITGWLLWFIHCLEKAIYRSEKILENVLAKSDFWKKRGGDVMNDRQKKVINRLLDAGKNNFEGGLTTRKYVAIAKTSRATAYREIEDLVAKKILVSNQAGGRSTSYELNWK